MIRQLLGALRYFYFTLAGVGWSGAQSPSTFAGRSMLRPYGGSVRQGMAGRSCPPTVCRAAKEVKRAGGTPFVPQDKPALQKATSALS
ncbi:MAG: hypothetical protein WCD43_12865 [Candidatus Acidiferrales bacterium]